MTEGDSGSSSEDVQGPGVVRGSVVSPDRIFRFGFELAIVREIFGPQASHTQPPRWKGPPLVVKLQQGSLFGQV